ncbi:MAG: hypothetical protein K2G13_01775 [Muribaculaceae bacterium]|nr:hypothetical protein [Muribaculaceae bacterium]
MKEKDLEKNLDNLIIDGLIKEAEQDNKDFEIAMRNMSDEDFLALIYDAVDAQKKLEPEFDDSAYYSVIIDYDIDENIEAVHTVESENTAFAHEGSDNSASNMSHPRLYRRFALNEEITPSVSDAFSGSSQERKSGNGRKWLPWLAAAVAAVAVVIAILIPAFNHMDSLACENALFAMNTYLPSSKGMDLSSVSKDEIRQMLPDIEKSYNKSLKKDEGIMYGVAPEANEETGLDYYTSSPRDAAWDLIEAYLRLGEKKKAVELLKTLSDQYGDTEDGDFCRHLITTLD